ncbi:MAG TPA: DUF5995 family protein [Symbiobacteriaceae bacterium]|nr:DUF5995 family protein [Symbiobacteriaceae bacterium]
MPDISIRMAGTDVASLDDLLAVMKWTLSRFDQAGDNRSAFLRVYCTMTGAVKDQMRTGFFLDPAWVERVAIRFAWWYFDALERFDRNDEAPPAWAYAFAVARDKQAFLLQDILMGMNAHINNDLPLVVAAILREEGDEATPGRQQRRRFDHDQINRVLHQVIPTVEREVARHYGRLLLPLGRVMGTLDQSLSLYGLREWRDHVWQNARFLLAARHKGERDHMIRIIQADALHVATSIERFPVLRHLRPLAPAARRWRLC